MRADLSYDPSGGGNTTEADGGSRGWVGLPIIDGGSLARGELLIVAFVLAGAVVVAATVGYAVAVPVGGMMGVAAIGGWHDQRTWRVPNKLVIAGALLVVISVPLVAVVDERGLVAMAGSAAAGLALSGAPLLFVTWLICPHAMGGGDWKLLSVLGAAVGLLAPVASLLIVITAGIVQTVQSLMSRRSRLPLAPGLAAGYAVAIVVAIVLSDLIGEPYA